VERALTGALPASLRSPLTRRWPPVARVLAGAAIGWAIAAWAVTTPGPSWRTPLAVAAMAVVALGAPLVAGAIALGGPPAWALASAVALYGGVPETDHIVGVAAGLAVLTLAELTGRARTDALTVVALGAVLVWAGLQGAGDHGPAVVAAFATLGLLALWPVVAHVPGPRRALVPRAVRPTAITALHAVEVVLVARRGATEASVRTVALAAAIGAILLVVAVRLAAGGRRL
jgi:hypothetical protein